MARRLLSDYIYRLQIKSITGEDAKTMCYLLCKYVEICKIEAEINPKTNIQQNGASTFYKKFILNINNPGVKLPQIPVETDEKEG
ncbi:MAG: hypothetical protein IPJ03_17690 [Ignavibacteriales bacterium]|nr:hypothetical protein [Ignavibacteriales bacterium]